MLSALPDLLIGPRSVKDATESRYVSYDNVAISMRAIYLRMVSSTYSFALPMSSAQLALMILYLKPTN